MTALREAAQMALPCPFCGSEKISVEEGATFRWVFAMCDACGAQAGEVRKRTIGEGTSEEWEADANRRAIAEWNTRAALAQPEQEPWGYISHRSWKMPVFVEADDLEVSGLPFNNPDYTPVYKAPPQREWQGLTDEEMLVAAFKAGFDVHEDYDNEDDPDALHWWSEDGEQCDDTLHKLRDIIEAKLREKNT